MSENTVETTGVVEEMAEEVLTPEVVKPKSGGIQLPTSTDIGQSLVNGAVTTLCGIAIGYGVKAGGKLLGKIGDAAKTKAAQFKAARAEAKQIKATEKEAQKKLAQEEVPEEKN